MTSTIVALLLAYSAPIHVRVDGEGYLRFAHGVQAVYSADANLVNQNGLICTPDGYPILPQTRLGPGASFSVQMDGTLSSGGKPIGRLILAAFPVGALQKFGKYWTANTRSQIGFPGEGVLGIIRSGTTSGASIPVAGSLKLSSNTETPTVEISLKSEIDKAEILIGDVATVQAPKGLAEQIESVDLGPTPMFGAQRGITRAYVSAAMRHAGIDVDKVSLLCPPSAFCVRKGQKVDSDALVAAAKTGVMSRLGVSEDLRSDRIIPEFFVPIGQLTITTVQAIAAGEGYTVNIEVDVDGKMITRRTLGLLPTAPAVKVPSGETVKIRVIKNGASVEVDGKTRAASKVGATVSVQSDAGATFTGVLVSTNLVEVKL